MTGPLRAEIGAGGGRPEHQPLRLAHRGDWRRGPENSLPAFRAALALPTCDGLELDVRRSRDGVPIVLHDATLLRVQGRDIPAADVSAAELVELGVPGLEAVLAEVPASAFLDVELKEDAGRSAIDLLGALRGDPPVNAVISSFEIRALETVARLAPRWSRWLNSVWLDRESAARAVDLGCRGIAAEWHSVDERGVDLARERGLEVAAWTVRRRSTFERLARLGVVAVCVEAAALDG